MALEIPTIGSPNSTQDPKIKSSLETLSGLLGASNKIKGAGIESETIENAQLKAEAKPFDWYTPKVIATEQERTNVAFGTLTTADEIASVVLPENGLIVIGYRALVSVSVKEAGKVAIFLNENQIKAPITVGAPSGQESGPGAAGSGVFRLISTAASGLICPFGGTEATSDSLVTTGQILGAGAAASGGGLVTLFAAAGTYNVSVRFKASSGKITAKERALWVAVLGV